MVNSFAQTKNEKESRIQLTEFPEKAKATLSKIPEKAKRIRHYRETDGDKLSFESKFKYRGNWFSVEFNNKGSIEDIEILVKEKELSTTIKSHIKSYLDGNSDSYEIIKIQEQYNYSETVLETQFLSSILEQRDELSSNYEVIVALKSAKIWVIKEMTFNSNGKFLNARVLQQDSYEYIMY